MASINELYKKISKFANDDGSFYKKLQSKLISIISNASIQAMNSDQGYCFKFSIKMSNYKDILNLLQLTNNDLYDAFSNDWGASVMKNHMHSDPYYQLFLLLLYFGLKEDNKKISESALSCIFFKLWNGRKTTFFQYCNKDIMKYVTTYMCSRKHLANKYDTPYEVIQNHFVPTVLKKYSDKVLMGPDGLKRVFEQSYTRLRQMFVSRSRIDLKTGKKVSDGGLLPLYMKAHEEGKSMSNIHVYNNDDSPAQFGDYMSASNLDGIISNTVEKIVMNPNKKYSNLFIENLRKEYRVKKNVIEQLASQLHNHEYHDQLYDIYNIILNKLEISNKDQICSPGFSTDVKNKIMGSKNNKSAILLEKKIMTLLEDMLQKTIQRSLMEYSNVFHIQLRKMIIRIMIYNLKSSVCK